MVCQTSHWEFFGLFSSPSFIAYFLLGILWLGIQAAIQQYFRKNARKDELADKVSLENQISILQRKMVDLSAKMQALSPVKVEKLNDLATQLNMAFKKVIELVSEDRSVPDDIIEHPDYYEEGAPPEKWQENFFISPESRKMYKFQNQLIGELKLRLDRILETVESCRLLLPEELSPKIIELAQDIRSVLEGYDQVDDWRKNEKYKKEKEVEIQKITIRIEYIRKMLKREIEPPKS